jgi:uncharacterized protein YbjT (DUF2867 family)
MKTYVILGATGNTGKLITLGLLEKGNAVRIVSRDASKATDLIAKGAQHFAGNADDASLLKKVFVGADAAYVLVAGDTKAADVQAGQIAIVNAIAQGLRGSSVTHVVTLSSVGAHLKAGAGIVQGLQIMEETLDALDGINVLHLRAAYFMENTLGMPAMAKNMGIIGGAQRADLKFSLVATKDIAAAALAHLVALDFNGKSHTYLLGDRDYTFNEIASIYGKAIGKPDLKYVQFPYADAKGAMLGMGFGESYTDKLLELVKGMNEGDLLGDAARKPEYTTPTSIEEFSHIFKAIYSQL